MTPADGDMTAPSPLVSPKAAWALLWRRDLYACAGAPAGADPKALLGMLKQAWSSGDQGAFLAATRALAAQGAIRPQYALKMARALLDVGAPGEAVALLKAAPPADPPQEIMHALVLAQALRGAGHDEQAAVAFARAFELGFERESPGIARRLSHALELERRAPALNGWAEWCELVCDQLQWGLTDRAAGALGAFFAAGPQASDTELDVALEFALAVFRVASPEVADELLAAMAPMYRREGLEQDHIDVTTGLAQPVDLHRWRKLKRQKSIHGGRLLRCLAAACAAHGRWRMAAFRFGGLSLSKRSGPVRADLARCIGQDLLREAPVRFGPPGPRRRIFDLFPYNGEAMMLAIKLNEMADWVDRFVIVEARSSFTGEPKPVHFEAQRPMFAAFEGKIEHVVVDAFPERLNSPWSREFFQRDSAARGLDGVWSPDDYVLITDVDEIIDRSALEGLERDIAPIRLRFFQYFLNCEYVMSQPSAQAVVAKARFLARNGSSYLRLAARDREKGRELEDAGWHFSSIDAPEALAQKMRSFSHQEHAHLDDKHFAELLEAIRNGETSVGRVRRELDDSFPAYVRQNRDALASYLL
jgi:beta-1,4-mannosyl-glycoprotein beta-1,4-N-acetylglucosaminyltransferase